MATQQSNEKRTWVWVVLNDEDTADAVFTVEELARQYAKARWAHIVHGPVELDPQPD